jgi:hypothetical protein
MRVSEIAGLRKRNYRVRDVFVFNQLGVKDGLAFGEFRATGYVPECLARIRASGIDFPEDLFAERVLVPLTEVATHNFAIRQQRVAIDSGTNSVFMVDPPQTPEE